MLKDFNNVYTWAPGVKASHALGTKSHEVGAGRFCDLVDFGQIEEYITRWDEGKGFVYNVSPLGPLTNGLSSWWLKAKTPDTTVLMVTFGYDLRFGVFGKAMHGLLMKNKLKVSLDTTLNSLKQCIETGKTIRPLAANAT